ncbi:hypothetical protein E2C01_094777 [Portunus trituberculatus]|uniref:Uncharacterized protein n=1 Tax=Portunus trituberculatus TaxID=210409 RepID=A0A5B7K1S5_PORTR|nr:hypothetical protein [Portunus trituberculatus]
MASVPCLPCAPVIPAVSCGCEVQPQYSPRSVKMPRGMRERTASPGELNRSWVIILQISRLEAIYGDPIVGALNPQQESLLLPCNNFIGASVGRS